MYPPSPHLRSAFTEASAQYRPSSFLERIARISGIVIGIFLLLTGLSDLAFPFLSVLGTVVLIAACSHSSPHQMPSNYFPSPHRMPSRLASNYFPSPSPERKRPQHESSSSERKGSQPEGKSSSHISNIVDYAERKKQTESKR